MTTIVLVVSPTSCRKCDACRAMCAEIEVMYPGQVQVQIIVSDDPEAARYGVVLPPTMAVDDFIVAAGSVPRKDAVFTLVSQSVAESV